MIVGIKVYKTDGSARLLDLKPDTRLRFEQLLPAFDDKLESGIYSFPVDVPWTEGNRQWLSFAENLNGHNSNIPEYWRCDIICNGITYMHEAKLKLLSHSGGFLNARGDYKFTITGIKGLFGNLIKGKKLRDLELDGKVTWDSALDSRQFAFNVMNSQDPANWAKFKFAPVLTENFIDTGRSDFNTEYLHNDTVNHMVIDPSFPDGWTFGRVKPSAVNAVLAPGDAGYADYRTVPYLNLFFVIRQIFIEHGFVASGSFFDYPNFDLIHIYNNVAIDRYNSPFAYDVNHEITPSNHLPDMLISDFLVAIQNSLNLKVDWHEDKQVLFSFKQSLLTSNKIENLSNKCQINYDEAIRHESYENGVKLEWKWDDDTYASDKVKDTYKLNIVATVTVASDIASLIFTVPIDDTTYIFVVAENYYYNYDVNNLHWYPAIENHDLYLEGKGEFAFMPELSPMCQAYFFDTFGNATRTNMVAATQRGSYINDWGIKVENPFGLRLFYITQIESGSYVGLPISFCHNYDSAGTKLVELSLSWLAEDGIYNKLWKSWLTMLYNSWSLKAKFLLDIIDTYKLKNEVDIIMANNNQYLIKHIAHDLPIEGITDVELVKL